MANKRMLSDWFSAALQTNRKCRRYSRKKRVVRNLFKVAALSAVALLTGCDEENESRSQTEFEKIMSLGRIQK